MTPATEDKTCHFFRLSAELRNKIYEEVLVSRRKIPIDTRDKLMEDSWTQKGKDDVFAQPGLLRTCRQIRAEAIGIYYLDNTFKFELDNLDASKLIAFCHQAVGYSEYWDFFQIRMCQGLDDDPSWSNLMKFLQAFHRGDVPDGQCYCGDWLIWWRECCPNAHMFKLVDRVDADGKRPWVEIQQILEIERAAVENSKGFTWKD